MKSILIACVVCLFSMTSQAQEQRNLSVPRGDARTLIFVIDEDVTADSVVFSTSLYQQETYNYSSNVTVRRANRHAYDGDDQQVFTQDSLTGRVAVYLGKTQTLAMSERQYYYTLRVNDSTKFYGTISMTPTNFTASVLTYLTNSDSLLFVTKKNPVIPGLGSGDTNQVVGFDSNGKLVRRWDNSGTLDSTTLFAQKMKVFEDGIAGKGDGDSLSTTTGTANAALPKADTTALHAQKLKVLEDVSAGKGDSDSLSTATSTANAALPKADTTALHAQKFKVLEDVDGGKGDSDSLSTATSTANAALPKADTTALHRQEWKINENQHAGFPNADSVHSVLDTVGTFAVAQAKLARDSVYAVGNSWWNSGAATGGDSVKTRYIDTIGVRVNQGDTLRFRLTQIFAPEFMPDHAQTTSYDAQKKIGWVEFETVIGGNLLKDATSPTEFMIIGDSANAVVPRYVEIMERSIEGTTLGKGNRCVTYISHDNTTGTGTNTVGRSCTIAVATGTELTINSIPTGSIYQFPVYCTSVAENVTWSQLTIRIGFVLPLANTSTWYVKPINH